MAQLERFLFDTDFEVEDPARAADEVEQADSAETEEEAEPEGPQPEYFEEDVEAARSEGYQRGHAAGHTEGLEAGRQDVRAQADQAIADALDRVAKGLEAAAGDLDAAEERRDREALQVATKLVQKLFPALHRRHGLKEIEALIADSLDRLREQPRVVVRVAPAYLETLQERIEALSAKAGYDGKVVVISDSDLPDGDVRVEWAEGGAERDTERLWREVDDAIARAMGGAEAAESRDTAAANAGDAGGASTAAPGPAGDGETDLRRAG